MSGTVLDMVKANLHITYALDSATKERLENEINDGIALIQKYCDPAATCEPGTAFSGILCEYVLRAESGAASTFLSDFAQEIRAGRISKEVEDYVEAMQYAAN